MAHPSWYTALGFRSWQTMFIRWHDWYFKPLIFFFILSNNPPKILNTTTTPVANKADVLGTSRHFNTTKRELMRYSLQNLVKICGWRSHWNVSCRCTITPCMSWAPKLTEYKFLKSFSFFCTILEEVSENGYAPGPLERLREGRGHTGVDVAWQTTLWAGGRKRCGRAEIIQIEMMKMWTWGHWGWEVTAVVRDGNIVGVGWGHCRSGIGTLCGALGHYG